VNQLATGDRPERNAYLKLSLYQQQADQPSKNVGSDANRYPSDSVHRAALVTRSGPAVRLWVADEIMNRHSVLLPK